MCGIAGIISLSDREINNLEANLQIMKSMIAHRGPSDSGYHLGRNFGMLNVRLAIVDQANGKQPMYSQDGRYGLVFNGEIYNHVTLREELEKDGYLFKTLSDTEVVLRLFEKYGHDAFAKLNGMFAAGIWDNFKKEITLVRDHLGIKPLYVYRKESTLIFSSELKAILALSELDRSINEMGVRDFLTFRYNIAPRTIFKHISKVPPATFLKINGSQVISYPFWEPTYEDPYIDHETLAAEELAEELEYLLRNAVKSQLMGEVPVGALLSGGLDSSLIAAELQELGVNLKTFNIGFPEVNEFQYSRAVATALSLEHIEIEIQPKDLVDQFEDILYFLDEPLADPACFPLFLLSQELKKHVTVVLSGEGADELFGGYPQYLRILNESQDKSFEDFMDYSHYFRSSDMFLKNPHTAPSYRDMFKYFHSADCPLKGALNMDVKGWLPDNLMMKADKITMSQSLEGRFPFLDIPLFEFAARLPQEVLITPNNETKHLLRKLGRKRLPSMINDRPKMGFTVPIASLLHAMKQQVMDSLCSMSSGPLSDIVDSDKVRNLAMQFFTGKKELALQLWTHFILANWMSHSLPQYIAEGKDLDSTQIKIAVNN